MRTYCKYRNPSVLMYAFYPIFYIIQLLKCRICHVLFKGTYAHISCTQMYIYISSIQVELFIWDSLQCQDADVVDFGGFTGIRITGWTLTTQPYHFFPSLLPMYIQLLVFLRNRKVNTNDIDGLITPHEMLDLEGK